MGDRRGGHRRIAGVLLDKDGTLFDFRATWLPAYRAIARELAAAAGDEGLAELLLRRGGYDAARDAFAARSPLLWGTTPGVARLFAAMPELVSVHGVSARVLAHLEDRERYPPVPVTDLAALFGRLRGRGLRLGVATMDGEAAARAALAGAGLDGVAFVAGCDSGHGLKPGPGMVRGFCAAVGLAPDEVVVVGDTHADLVMARAAGAAMAVAVLTGATPRPVLERLADRVLASIAELEPLLDAAGALGSPQRSRSSAR